MIQHGPERPLDTPRLYVKHMDYNNIGLTDKICSILVQTILTKMGFWGKYGFTLPCSLINGSLRQKSSSIKHQPQRLEKESVVSRFSGAEHLRGRQKIHVPPGQSV